MTETADLKSLARRVLVRDTARDTVRDAVSRGRLVQGKPARQGPAPYLGASGRCPDPFDRYLVALGKRCPDLIDGRCWQQAVEDGWRFLGQWGDQAHALGWTARDLFGLAAVPDRPAPNYRRLSRYDQTGLVWLLQGRPVMALTQDTAVIENATGTVSYRRYDKPALGPLGDSLNDMV